MIQAKCLFFFFLWDFNVFLLSTTRYKRIEIKRRVLLKKVNITLEFVNGPVRQEKPLPSDTSCIYLTCCDLLSKKIKDIKIIKIFF